MCLQAYAFKYVCPFFNFDTLKGGFCFTNDTIKSFFMFNKTFTHVSVIHSASFQISFTEHIIQSNHLKVISVPFKVSE